MVVVFSLRTMRILASGIKLLLAYIGFNQMELNLIVVFNGAFGNSWKAMTQCVSFKLLKFINYPEWLLIVTQLPQIISKIQNYIDI